MIESIELRSIATYGNESERLNGLSKFNFLYGSNGSGKTTISRVVADEEEFPTCTVAWKGGTKLQTMVYNRDFVERNFNPSTELKGIFTLGEKNIDTVNQIAVAKTELVTLKAKIEDLKIALQGQDGGGGKKGELTALEEKFKNQCWEQKKKHDPKFFGAFGGYRNNSENFKAKLLLERASISEAPVELTDHEKTERLAELEKRSESIFGTTPTTEQSITPINTAEVIGQETNPILKKRVIGKEDVDIAAMIKKLGSSDWIKEGRTFYDVNEKVCPFCQQPTTDAFAESLNKYFDETFVSDIQAIDDLVVHYKNDSERLIQQIAAAIATSSRFLNVENLKDEKVRLESTVMINIQRLDSKKKEPSQIFDLESIKNIAAMVTVQITDANAKIADHNKIVDNLADERRKLTARVWKYLLEVELKKEFANYESERTNLNKAITGIEAKIQSVTKDMTAKALEIRELEKQTTSIEPTIKEINALMSNFGFRSFSLSKTENGPFYKLGRPNGDDAKETLSEGEKSFITFLYFYYLLKGTNSETGMTMDRVVVIDDPVSSLDSDILFIVCSLIKSLFDEIRSGAGHVRQIFILTHNVYFHKEITFNKKRTNKALPEETFWIVRKFDMASKLEQHKSNPIKTSYELLWFEVRRQDPPKLTIQNTLRRILEYYFKILGGIDSDDICAKFDDGNEKLICKSLFSWVNDGSHFAHDDLFVSIDDSMIGTYLKVFRGIFEKADQLAHYKMMMGDAYTDEPSGVKTD